MPFRKNQTRGYKEAGPKATNRILENDARKRCLRIACSNRRKVGYRTLDLANSVFRIDQYFIADLNPP
jgi:hypothetical protein